MNAYIYNAVEMLTNEGLTISEKGMEPKILDNLPDGAITVKELNKRRFKYNL
jgi:hypothetical protein